MQAKHFRRWLETMEITGEQAARMLGVSPNTITRYKKRGGPRLLSIACHALVEPKLKKLRKQEYRKEALRKKKVDEEAIRKQDAEKRAEELKRLDTHNKFNNIPRYALRLYIDGCPIDEIAVIFDGDTEQAKKVISEAQTLGLKPWDYATG